jgi:hypothetical protein
MAFRLFSSARDDSSASSGLKKRVDDHDDAVVRVVCDAAVADRRRSIAACEGCADAAAADDECGSVDVAAAPADGDANAAGSLRGEMPCAANAQGREGQRKVECVWLKCVYVRVCASVCMCTCVFVVLGTPHTVLGAGWR